MTIIQIYTVYRGGGGFVGYKICKNGETSYFICDSHFCDLKSFFQQTIPDIIKIDRENMENQIIEKITGTYFFN